MSKITHTLRNPKLDNETIGDAITQLRLEADNLEQMAALKKVEADILDNDWRFPALYDTLGERVPAVLVNTRYGQAWALCHPKTGKFTGSYVGSQVQPRTLTRKGYKEGTERAPAKAVIVQFGEGDAWYIDVVRLDGGYPGRPGAI